MALACGASPTRYSPSVLKGRYRLFCPLCGLNDHLFARPRVRSACSVCSTASAWCLMGLSDQITGKVIASPSVALRLND
jgi:hypothetical protein